MRLTGGTIFLLSWKFKINGPEAVGFGRGAGGMCPIPMNDTISVGALVQVFLSARFVCLRLEVRAP